MSKFLKLLLSKLTINETYQSASWMKDIEEWLDEKASENWFKGKFTVRKVGFEEYKISSKFSMGTVNLWWSNGIYCFVKLNAPKQEQLTISTRIRREHYFILIIFLLMLVGGFSAVKNLFFIPATIVIQLIIHLWFQMVYRWQERSLIDKIQRSLRLRDLE